MTKDVQAFHHYAELIDLSYDAMLVWSMRGAIEVWNLGAEKLYGFKKKEAIGKAPHQLLQTRFPRPWSEVESVLLKNKFWEGELEQQTKDGRTVIVLAKMRLVRGVDGVNLILETNRELRENRDIFKRFSEEVEERAFARTSELIDLNHELNMEIEERRKAEEDVKIEQKRLNDVLEMLPAYIILLTPDYHVAFANRFFRERFGESNGRCCYEFLFGRSEPCENCRTYNVLKNMKPLEWEWTGPDGRDYQIYDYPFVDMDDATLILEMGIDISERKRAEAELQNAHNILEIRVRERTAELVQSNAQLRTEIEERLKIEKALRQSEERYRALAEELREADRRKNEFLAVLSHELRNPLTPIYNSLHILEKTAPGGEQAKRAKEVIHRQIRQLSRLVEDLLDATRIRQNRIKLQMRRVELNELMRRVIEDHRMLFEKNGIRLEAQFSSSPVFVMVDEIRMTQVAGNLLQNAAKFTGPEGEPRVFVECESEGKQAVIRITDTGIGMTQEMLSRLFTPFMQADTTLDRSRGGLGLGLALSKGLIELHGGELKAFSEGIGKGSKFIIQLPLEDAIHEESLVLSPDVSRPNLRVLIIDDNVDLADSLCELLELNGHKAVIAHNGSEGIEKARKFKPEVVLCDIGLPGMDGYEVARAFRGDKELSDVYLVALTGYALPEDSKKAAQAGFNLHIAKPVSLDALQQILARIK